MFFLVEDTGCMDFLDIMFARSALIKEWTNRKGISTLDGYFAGGDDCYYSDFWQHIDIDDEVAYATEVDFLI